MTTRLVASRELAAFVRSVVEEWGPYIDQRPELLSLLYDVDLLPEQLLHVLRVNSPAAAPNARRMVAICMLWDEAYPDANDRALANPGRAWQGDVHG